MLVQGLQQALGLHDVRIFLTAVVERIDAGLHPLFVDVDHHLQPQLLEREVQPGAQGFHGSTQIGPRSDQRDLKDGAVAHVHLEVVLVGDREPRAGVMKQDEIGPEKLVWDLDPKLVAKAYERFESREELFELRPS